MLDSRSKVKVGIPESFKVEWYPHKITGSSHLKGGDSTKTCFFSNVAGRIAALLAIDKYTYSHISHKRCFKISLKLTKRKQVVNRYHSSLV